MSEQLLLNLIQPIRYSAENYVLHSGIAEVAANVLVPVCRKSFSIAYVQGDRWSGKTHFGAYLTGELHGRGLPARFLEGSEVASWFATDLQTAPLRVTETIIIDDADHFLRAISKSGQTDIFIDLMESLRSLKGSLVLLGTFGAEELGCGAELVGRMRAGLHVRIGPPAEGELGQVLDVICQQRGLKLSAMKRNYVLRRVKGEIQGLVECVEKVEGISEASSTTSTSFQVLAEAVGVPEGEPGRDAAGPLKVLGWR